MPQKSRTNFAVAGYSAAVPLICHQDKLSVSTWCELHVCVKERVCGLSKHSFIHSLTHSFYLYQGSWIIIQAHT